MPDDRAKWIAPTRGAKTLPVEDLLTGRGFITGKSGSGKSNTANVVAENLLDSGYNLAVVDPEGEYYGLKERYELLHVGGGDLCDVQVGPEDGERLAEITLGETAPIIIDVSDYLDEEKAHGLIADFVEALFRKENSYKMPYLLMIEEMQEYMPQSGGKDELAKLLAQVAKRGRKRGLGVLGMSQRPAAVDKEFITQCDWMVWHRLTWENDLDVVRKILGSEKADEIKEFDPGEAYLMTDWDEQTEKVQFKRKQTHDAGATPGLDDYDRPDLKTVDRELINKVAGEPTSGAETGVPPQAAAGTARSAGTATPKGAARNGHPPDDQAEGAQAQDGRTGNGQAPDDARATTDELHQAVEDLEILGHAENGEGDDLASRDVEALDREELETYVSQLERRNEILADEVTELRSILEQFDADGRSTTEPKPAPASNQQMARTSAGGSPQPASPGSAPESSETVPSRTGVAGATDPSRSTPPKPEAPPRPPNRSGVAGTIVEVVEMLGYFKRLLGYRIRLAMYSGDEGAR